MKILLIEDEIELQNLFKSNFEELGYIVKATDSVEKALPIYNDFMPEVIIADIDLNGQIKGHEIINILAKKYTLTPDVILMSGRNIISKEEAFILGAKNFLEKPFKFKEICLNLQQITLMKKASKSLLDKLSQITNSHSIGVRIVKGVDFPYHKYKGFSDEFILIEKFLCRKTPDGKFPLECMCGSVIEGRVDPTKPCFTDKGSFFTNNVTKLINLEKKNKTVSNRRNNCNKFGYESIILTPIKTKKRTLGLIQCNDYSINKFPKTIVTQCEILAEDFAKELEYLV